MRVQYQPQRRDNSWGGKLPRNNAVQTPSLDQTERITSHDMRLPISSRKADRVLGFFAGGVPHQHHVRTTPPLLALARQEQFRQNNFNRRAATAAYASWGKLYYSCDTCIAGCCCSLDQIKGRYYLTRAFFPFSFFFFPSFLFSR